MRLLPFLVLLLLASIARAQQPDTTIPDQTGRLSLKLLPTLAPPAKLTGDLSDPVWRDAADFPMRNGFTGQSMPIKTQVKAFATADSIYVGFICDEPDMKSLLTNGMIWDRDSVEVFLAPGMDLRSRPYHEIDIDSNGASETHFAHIYPSPKYFNMKYGEQKWEPKLQIATARASDHWTAEICIPIDQLHIDEAQKDEHVWRIDFHRNRPSRGGSGVMNWGWSPVGARSYHMAGRFGVVLIDRDNMLEVKDLDLPAATDDDKRWLAPPDNAFIAQIDQAVAMLSSDKHTAKAVDRLKSLARQNIGGAIIVQQKIAATIHTPNTAAEDVTAYCQLLPLQNDDDPPPPEIKDRIDSFEPRIYRDAGGMTLPYRLLRPADFDPKKTYPAVLYLHGFADKGSDNRRQLGGFAMAFTSKDLLQKYPCFVIVPQCPKSGSWSLLAVSNDPGFRYADKPSDPLRMALEITDAVRAEFPAIDPARIYIVGESMGGSGAYEAVYRRPNYFAAAAPFSGDGVADAAKTLAATPFWIFHSQRDALDDPAGPQAMSAAIQKAGGNATLKMLARRRGEDSIPTLDADFLNWLFSQKRAEEKPKQ